LSNTFSRANQVFPGFPDFLVFFCMPFFIETMFPKRISIQIGLVIAFIVQAFKQIGV